MPTTSDRLPLLVLAAGAVLLAIGWVAFSFEVALAVLVGTLTLATGVVVARLVLTDRDV